MGVSGIFIIPIILLLVNTAVTDNKKKPVYGFDITIAQAPYLATLREYNKEIRFLGSGVLCTATIIRNRVLLTAAHSIFRKRKNDLVVVIGSTHLRIRSPTTKMLRISAWRWHPLFKTFFDPYDIAVVFTLEAIEPVEGAVGYAPLNTMEVRKGTKCLETGWTVAKGGAENLQSVWVTSTSRRECYDIYVHMGLMCTYPNIANESLVRNDAGAPIMCNGKLSGVAILTSPVTKATGNTAVHLYIKWIRAAIYLHFKATRG